MNLPWRTWRWLALALLAHVVLAGTYALRTPAWEGPDENDHAYYAWYLSATGSQPRILESGKALGRPAYEEGSLGHHPPGYYAALAALTRLSGGTDHAPFWTPNPTWETGGRTKWLHGHDEHAPVSREICVLWVLRGFSVALGALSILCTWLLARTVFPTRHATADAAALLLAAVPQWAWMHGVLDNGNLATMLGALWLWWLARTLRRGEARWRDGVVLGSVLGAALLTKLTALFLLPLLFVVGCLAAGGWRAARGQTLAVFALALGLALLIASPWFWHNLSLYGDPLALAPHEVAYHSNTLAAAAEQLEVDPDALRWRYLTGDFVTTTLATAWAGVGWSLQWAPAWQLWVVLALALAATAACLARARALLREGGLPLVAALGAIALTVAGLVKFNLTFLQPQGRYLFPAFGALAVLAATALPARGVMRVGLLTLLIGNAFALQHGWFLPALAPGEAPSAHYASMFAGLAGEQRAEQRTLICETPAPGATMPGPPTFRWRDPNGTDDSLYSVHVALPSGQTLGSFETRGLALSGTSWTLPDAIWRALPAGQPLRWRVRRVPDRLHHEATVDVAASEFQTLTRIE